MSGSAPVLVTRPIPEPGLQVLRDAGIAFELRDRDAPPDAAELQALLPGRTGVLCQLTDPFTEAVLAAGDALQVVATMSVGVDHIDLAAAAARGISVANTPGVLTDATAECAVALLFAVARRVVEGDRLTRAGEFTAWGPMLLLGAPVAGRTVGIVGAGRIGQAMAQRCHGLGMQVIYWSRAPKPAFEQACGAERRELDDLLREADVVSLHCALTPDTRHLIDARRLALMKPTAILVNTARGPVVDESALVAALQAGAIRGAGLDVYEDEPALAPGLAACTNAVLLPHVGSATDATRGRMAAMAAADLVAVLQGRPPAHPVAPPS